MSKITRRKFLRNSFVAGSALALYGCQSSPRVIGANDRLRIAVAGVNSRGGSHIKGWLEQDNVEIAYLIDPDRNVLAQKLKNLNEKTEGKSACKGVADVREALDDKNLDAISIATPNHWHSLMTIWAAQAGKHVYVEKPMSHDIAEGRVCVEAQKKYGVVIQHGTQSRSSVGKAGLHDLIRSGKFGKMKISYGYCCKPRSSIGFEIPSAPPAHLDWNLWRGPAIIDQYHA
ncbi:MAG: Gfo/Idh/MocA family protein, partial [Planctomycetota bacterium]